MTGSTALSEVASRALLEGYGVPFPPTRTVRSPADAARSAEDLGFPVALKVSSAAIAHKSERGLVRLGLGDARSVHDAVVAMTKLLSPEDGPCEWTLSPMVVATRELLVGLVRDESFGPMVVVGIGGVLAEAIGDVAMAPATLGRLDAKAMLGRLTLRNVVGAVRGERAVDADSLQVILDGLARLASERPDVRSVDVNPLRVLRDGSLVAVDALVEIGRVEHSAAGECYAVSDRHAAALFDPRGVVVVGASSHPGKFGFVSLHNLLANGYQGRVAAVNRSGESVLGITPIGSVSELPKDEFDLAVLCTPPSANEEVLESCAERGIRAVFVASAGYRESGPDGAQVEERLASLARRLGLLLVGPNGQGVVSTPASMCAQIVAPFPPRGGISVVSQSGNLVSSWLNLSRSFGVGIARAVSVGNAALVGPAQLLEALSRDEETTVGLVYLENAGDGGSLATAFATFSARKPLVVLKGGVSDLGARAAASHTGALASPARVVEAVVEDAGATLATDVDEAFDIAAAFATLPVPRGGRVAILTTVGGWGVLSADAVARSRHLSLAELPAELLDAIGALLPGRWSRNNPIDCAGGETRDTVPTILRLLAECPGVDAVVLLGAGIQGNQAGMMRSGRFFPDHGLERIVAYHERQEARYMEAVRETMAETAVPILVATELAVASPDNPAPRTARALGMYCFPSGPRAIRAIDALVARARRSDRAR